MGLYFLVLVVEKTVGVVKPNTAWLLGRQKVVLVWLG
jgi:hypothetical protein